MAISESAIISYMYLRKDLTRELVDRTIRELIPWFELMSEDLFREKKVDAFMDPWWAGCTLVYPLGEDGKIDIGLTNWQLSRFSKPKIAGGRRQVIVSIAGREMDDTLFYYLYKNPDIASELVHIYTTIASCFSAYAGIFGIEDTMYYSEKLDGLDFLTTIFTGTREFSSLFMDTELVDSIGMSDLERWASIIEKVGDDGYFVSKSETPIISRLSNDPWKDDYYIEHIAPKMVERIWSELASLDST